MKRARRIQVIVVVFLLLSILPAKSPNESQIMTNPSNQFFPAIYGKIVVWEDDRNGDLDIYGCKFSTLKELPIAFPIATGPSDQRSPAIYGNYVVWMDNRNGDWDIYGYDISGGPEEQEFLITTDPNDPESPTKGDQESPVVYGNIVVWQDKRNGNWDIYYYDLSTKNESRITTDPGDQTSPAICQEIIVWEDERNNNKDICGYDLSKSREFFITKEENDQRSPAVCGNIVVWMEFGEGGYDIHGYDLHTEENLTITEDPNEQRSPAIYGGYVVWHDNRHGGWDIYGRNLSEENEFSITKNPGNQRSPAIYGDYVVWMDNRNYYWDIHGYNLSKEEELQITTDPNEQQKPAIYGDIVVWEDNRNDNWDIYGYDLSEEKEFPITTDLNEQRKPAIYGNYVVWQDNRNGDWDIYGYDIFEKKEFLITKNPNDPKSPAEGDQESPAIYGNIIVWQDKRNGNWDIYGYNLSTGEEFQITTSLGDEQKPAIHQDIVVWQDNRNGNWDIYYRKLQWEDHNDHRVLTSEEVQITTDPNEQQKPAIYGEIIMWEDNRNDNWDIYGYDLSEEKEFLITESLGNKSHPAIYENIIVWENREYGSINIHSYNLSTEVEDPIATHRKDQSSPKIYGGTIVWEDERSDNKDIYKYNLLTEREFSITTSPGDQRSPAIFRKIVIWKDNRNGNWDIYKYNWDIYKKKYNWITRKDILFTDEELPITKSEANQTSPAIHSNYVVWTEYEDGYWHIYGYRLSQGQKFLITTSEADQPHPVVSWKYVIWEDKRNGSYDIYGYDLSEKQEFQITEGLEDQKWPQIHGDYVVWQENRNGNWDIYYRKLQWEDHNGHRVLTSEKVQITTDPNDQQKPAIYGDYVVWMDNRNGDWDIYGYDISGGPEGQEFLITKNPNDPKSPAEGDQEFPVIYGDYVVWQDNRNGNWDIYYCKLQWEDHNDHRVLTSEEVQITTDQNDQISPAIYGKNVVWESYRNQRWNIYRYNISTDQESPILERSKEQPEPHFFGRPATPFAKMFIFLLLMIAIVVLFYALTPEEEIGESKVYKVNALKDPFSRVVLGRRRNYCMILLILFSVQVTASLISGTLKEIDINSLPREEVVLLNEEVFLLPTVKEWVYFVYYVVSLFICVAAENFFRNIPNVFKTLFENGIITKKGSTKKKILSDFNESLGNLENRINQGFMYVPAIVFSFFGGLFFNPHVRVRDPGFVGWRHFYLFEVNWILFSVIAFFMFLVLGLFIWKIFFIVDFMRKLDKKYNLVLKPYDTDGLGGFKPFEQLWFNVTLVTLPVILNFFTLFVLDRFSQAAFFPGRIFILLGLYIIVVFIFLIYPVWNYHRIVKERKEKFLKSIEKKINMYYRKVERDLSREEKVLDRRCREEIKQLDELFVRKVKSIPSWPFTTLKKAGIFLGVVSVISAVSVVTPWITKIIDYISIWI